MKKTYVVIGLGRFGTAIASRLFALGNEVLAIDTDAGKVQHAEPFVTYAVIGDARDEEVLRSLGVNNYDCAVVAIGKDLATSVIVTLNLKELGIQRVICKATDEIQKKALEKVKTGAINVDVECNPYQGKYIEEIIQALETGQSIEKDNYVEEKVFTQKNVLSVLNDRTY